MMKLNVKAFMFIVPDNIEEASIGIIPPFPNAFAHKPLIVATAGAL
jgi:hypothetical protein